MLYSSLLDRNVGKSLTLGTLAKAQGITGDIHPLHCSGGDQTISGVSLYVYTYCLNRSWIRPYFIIIRFFLWAVVTRF